MDDAGDPVSDFQQREAVWEPFGSYKRLNKYKVEAERLGARVINRLQCVSVCPVDAISIIPGKPAKFNMDNEMEAVKKMMSFKDHPMAEQTRMPPWMKAKMKGGGNP